MTGLCKSQDLLAYLFGLTEALDVSAVVAHIGNEYCGRCSWVLGVVRKAAESAKNVDELMTALRLQAITLPDRPQANVRDVARRAGDILALRVDCRTVASYLYAGVASHYFSEADLLPHLARCSECRSLIKVLVDQGEQFLELIVKLQRLEQVKRFDANGFTASLERARQLGHILGLQETCDALRGLER